jgi:hypothetical protein
VTCRVKDTIHIEATCESKHSSSIDVITCYNGKHQPLGDATTHDASISKSNFFLKICFGYVLHESSWIKIVVLVLCFFNFWSHIGVHVLKVKFCHDCDLKTPLWFQASFLIWISFMILVSKLELTLYLQSLHYIQCSFCRTLS